MTVVGQRVGAAAGQVVGQRVTATPSYAEAYYLDITPPSQGLITEVVEGVGALTGVADYAIAVKFLRTGTAAGGNDSYHSALTAGGHPIHTVRRSATSTRQVVGLWQNSTNYTAGRTSPADPVPGAAAVLVTYVRRKWDTGSNPFAFRQVVAGTIFHTGAENQPGDDAHIPRDVVVGLPVAAPPAGGISSSAGELRFVGAVISAAPIPDALLVAWSEGPVNMAAELDDCVASWLAGDYDGVAMASRVTGGARLLSSNMTMADRVEV